MAEVPSVLFNLERYAALGIAGSSIGPNDLTQLTLGAERDSELMAEVFDERDPAVADYLRQLIPRARALGLQTPSADRPRRSIPSTPNCWSAAVSTRSPSTCRRPHKAARRCRRDTPTARRRAQARKGDVMNPQENTDKLDDPDAQLVDLVASALVVVFPRFEGHLSAFGESRGELTQEVRSAEDEATIPA